MEPSDWIALAAIGATIVTVVVTGVQARLNARDARTQQRLEAAYVQLVEHLEPVLRFTRHYERQPTEADEALRQEMLDWSDSDSPTLVLLMVPRSTHNLVGELKRRTHHVATAWGKHSDKPAALRPMADLLARLNDVAEQARYDLAGTPWLLRTLKFRP